MFDIYVHKIQRLNLRSFYKLCISFFKYRSEDPDAEDVGHKWTLSALLRHLRSIGQDTEQLMQRIEDIIIKSILATASGIVSGVKQFVKHPETCFGNNNYNLYIIVSLQYFYIPMTFPILHEIYIFNSCL